jgi:hypothetical protein
MPEALNAQGHFFQNPAAGETLMDPEDKKNKFKPYPEQVKEVEEKIKKMKPGNRVVRTKPGKKK